MFMTYDPEGYWNPRPMGLAVDKTVKAAKPRQYTDFVTDRVTNETEAALLSIDPTYIEWTLWTAIIRTAVEGEVPQEVVKAWAAGGHRDNRNPGDIGRIYAAHDKRDMAAAQLMRRLADRAERETGRNSQRENRPDVEGPSVPHKRQGGDNVMGATKAWLEEGGPPPTEFPRCEYCGFNRTQEICNNCDRPR